MAIITADHFISSTNLSYFLTDPSSQIMSLAQNQWVQTITPSSLPARMEQARATSAAFGAEDGAGMIILPSISVCRGSSLSQDDQPEFLEIFEERYPEKLPSLATLYQLMARCHAGPAHG